MPFIDLNTQPISFSQDAFDIVIVGAGAAGILLAVKLSGKGKKVVGFQNWFNSKLSSFVPDSIMMKIKKNLASVKS